MLSLRVPPSPVPPIGSYMPTSCNLSAPKFIPTPTVFNAFFEDLEDCLKQANLTTSRDAIRWAERYASALAEDWELVSCLAAANADPDHEAPKADVREVYPQLDEKMFDTPRDLGVLITSTTSLSSTSHEVLGSYVCPSYARACSLQVKQNLLSNREPIRLLLPGFPDAMRDRFATRLSVLVTGLNDCADLRSPISTS